MGENGSHRVTPGHNDVFSVVLSEPRLTLLDLVSDLDVCLSIILSRTAPISEMPELLVYSETCTCLTAKYVLVVVVLSLHFSNC